MSIKKQFLKSKPVCKVSFKLTRAEAGNGAKVNLVGDFNNWNESADELKALKDGSFSHTIELESGREYQFRYLIDNKNWLNDTEADSYRNNGVDNSQNAVIVL